MCMGGTVSVMTASVRTSAERYVEVMVSVHAAGVSVVTAGLGSCARSLGHAK